MRNRQKLEMNMDDYSKVSAEIEEALEELIIKCGDHNKLPMLSYFLNHAKIEAKDRKMDKIVLN